MLPDNEGVTRTTTVYPSLFALVNALNLLLSLTPHSHLTTTLHPFLLLLPHPTILSYSYSPSYASSYSLHCIRPSHFTTSHTSVTFLICVSRPSQPSFCLPATPSHLPPPSVLSRTSGTPSPSLVSLSVHIVYV
ncbi:hypothetical protein E2C01_078604 [Portunus trituberculatus]|uniref:Uncharacterized protein n=1 Tax=Portunus trituberculatus TaxID=210409 RepID=A0A5B7IN55_PORTR|nr:hypothetical protein [Portunus trituberculatus]